MRFSMASAGTIPIKLITGNKLTIRDKIDMIVVSFSEQQCKLALARDVSFDSLEELTGISREKPYFLLWIF